MSVAGKEIPKSEIGTEVSGLTQEEKIGQMFFIAMRWDANGKGILSLGDAEKSLLRELQPGGVVLYAVNMHDVAQVRNLVRQIRACLRVEPFIAVDEEGGRVSRFRTGLKQNAIHAPSARRQFGSGAVGKTYELLAVEMRAMGINLDLAPVADLDYNPDSEVVGDRAFSRNPDQVSAAVMDSMAALQSNNVLAVVKHFPGHGRAAGDTHQSQQTVEASWSELLKSDVVPFSRAINGGTFAIMTAHIRYPSVDPTGFPVSMSPVLLQQKLRGELGFQGLIITDALEMKGMEAGMQFHDAVLQMIASGVDVLMEPAEPRKLFAEIVAAVSDGRLTEARIDDSVFRILAAKKRFSVSAAEMDPALDEQSAKFVGSAVHQDELNAALR